MTENDLPDEAKTPAKIKIPGISTLQEFIEASAKANGIEPWEAAAAFEDNGWDTLIMEKYDLKP